MSYCRCKDEGSHRHRRIPILIYVRRRKRKAVGIPYTGKIVTEIECGLRPNLSNVIVLDIHFILYQQRTRADDLMYSHERRIKGDFV